MPRTRPLLFALMTLAVALTSMPAADPIFHRRVLTDLYLADGVTAGDLDRDGDLDIVAGSLWHEGPDFVRSHALGPSTVHDPRESPSAAMFSYLHDFDGDGWLDVLRLGRVHKHAAIWLENPGAEGGEWTAHPVFERIRGESPPFVDIDLDGTPELVCHHEGRWGWVEADPTDPRAPWRFRAVTPRGDYDQFYHGTGVGDVDGDGLPDLILAEGVWLQRPDAESWTLVAHRFGTRGGAQMPVFDVDGDGDADIVSSLDAHGWGLAWFEQVREGGAISFRQHDILGDRSQEARFGAAFSQPHALATADIDGDGLLDVVTGKRRWAHGPTGDVEPAGAPVVHWLRLVRDESGARFEPRLVDSNSGVGVQITAVDVTADGRPDILTASKLGVFLFVNDGAARNEPAAARRGLRPWREDPRYWEHDGRPLLLIGGSDDDNLFQWPDVVAHLDLLRACGGNYVRNTMSDRRDKGFEVYAYLRRDDGKYDLGQWNPEYWERFERFLAATAERGIFVQIEVWDRFDYSDVRGSSNWKDHPYNPKNNIDYTAEETGLATAYPNHPGANDQPFFYSVPALRDNQTLLHHQERRVAKLLEHSLRYGHVLYCIDNETSGDPEWGKHWARFIRDRARAAGTDVPITEMWDQWDPKGPEHRRTFDHPETYSFVDVSQNNHNRGQSHWDNLQWVRRYIAPEPRPINSVKIYGADTGRFGKTRDGEERFWRNLVGGLASIRFHRPDSGLGLGELARAHLRSARSLLGAVDLLRCEPDAESRYLVGRELNEAYLARRPGEAWVVYFPDGGEVGLDLRHAAGSRVALRWLDVATSAWSPTEELDGGEVVPLAAPGRGHRVALLERVDASEPPRRAALDGHRPRVIASTDIGGGDPDDFQSMVHLLLYADVLDIEGLVASPPHQGRARDIHEVIDAYERDWPQLRAHGPYPSADLLRAVVRQGAEASAAPPGHGEPTAGSRWIIERARARDPRPLHVIVWGGLTDLAQAVHDDPAIVPKLRVHSIGSWNTRNDRHARDWLERSAPDLWWIESDTTFRGMYIGGDQSGDRHNRRFVDAHVVGHGALGDLFFAKKKDIKMGDSPSVLWLLRGDPSEPTLPSWGGSYVPVPGRPAKWVDDPRPELREGDKSGARTVSRHRAEWLEDWRRRLDRALPRH